MEIRFLEIAQVELDEAVEYYNSESPGSCDQFLLEVLSTLERIRHYPEGWHPFTHILHTSLAVVRHDGSHMVLSTKY